ncbi:MULTISPECIES: hypothetical protein [unclassified Pseudofrankia]|uniref:hypothetical protein n=1 Tax=unclassified Pseudofrankia TaxID=2994372 RepID=UPI0008DAB0E0|nr:MULTISPECIES: hypothetical protein [unclassified Pseudofrankia]MDT3445766.1 hypothetical protein [Pseudofrankia sp. BMG5.37]OHV62775.1 hypothetical protein BCD48_39075 [Pseudofrankia sp. BMG5.36]
MEATAPSISYFLNHAELLHRPGERELAVLLFETLGCAVLDITKDFGASSTYLGVFGPTGERDSLNNVLYLSEMRGQRSRLGELLESRARDDDELRAELKQNDADRQRPGATAHFGLRYASYEELDAVVDRLQNQLPAELAGRVTLYPPFEVGLRALDTEVRQVFVFTDVIGPGFFPFGQLIELQAHRPLLD